MSAPTNEGTTPSSQETVEAVNDVRLVGRLAAPAESRELPSGDTLVAFRVVVDRPPGQQQRQRVDALECVVWSGRVKRSVRTWREGDVVEVSGSIRRRFFRTAVGTGSRVEVEVRSGRVLRRARSG
ncbi:single-stranded DNA-binding protein [Nocardioides dongxiaopingii]|uniref:single-stranded DNA-binding protein n=1 Tax=Nocardioides TaxID=1839 RepID=UPI0010C76674|nr:MULTISPECIES: single-stranded DNA-binding protein [Nocardioides]QCW50899.1 single-stranded DNA-binding protein [Nocardioides sp. S-1144]